MLMPSCAAGPVSATDWPSRMLFGVTPCCAAAGRATKAATAMMVLIVMCVSSFSSAHGKEFRVPDQLRHIQFLPALALLVLEFTALPRRRLARGGKRLQLLGIAQAERAVDQQAGRGTKALAEQQQARML